MSEKTEQPTAKKLREARQKGQVAQSRDLTSTALLIALFAYVMIASGELTERMQALIVLPGDLYQAPFPEALDTMSAATVDVLRAATIPLLGMVMIFGVAAGFLQIGPVLALEQVKPDLKKLNPFDKLKQMFSMKNLIEFLKSVVKVVFLCVLLYLVIKNSLGALMTMPYGSLPGVQMVLNALMFKVALYTVFAYVVIAAADFWFQRWRHTKDLMMSKDEVKREYKEMEGDPHIKSKRKQLHQEMVMNDSMANVRKSTVLVTNPTHKAIAIYYKQGETKLPLVTAKGEGFLAQRMIEVAREEGIPIMQNVPLAHELFDQGQLDHYIPSELIEPIAEILRWVQQLTQDNQPQ